jgi:WD40 repeat protein
VRSDVSPDGQYLVSGSEDGNPRIWDASLEQSFRSSPYECNILDMVADCRWNPRYNMFALSGFGQKFPVLVYVYQRSQEELDRILLSGGGIQIGSDRAEEFMNQKNQEALPPTTRRERGVSLDQ